MPEQIAETRVNLIKAANEINQRLEAIKVNVDSLRASILGQAEGAANKALPTTISESLETLIFRMYDPINSIEASLARLRARVEGKVTEDSAGLLSRPAGY